MTVLFMTAISMQSSKFCDNCHSCVKPCGRTRCDDEFNSKNSTMAHRSQENKNPKDRQLPIQSRNEKPDPEAIRQGGSNSGD